MDGIGDPDFEQWGEELADQPPARTPEDLLLRLDALFVEYGYQALAQALPCTFCGEPCRSRGPEGWVRHPCCPRSPEEQGRAARAKAASERLRAEAEARERIRELLDRLWNPETPD